MTQQQSCSVGQLKALIGSAKFRKIENILELPSSDLSGFRRSMTRFLWRFYQNSLPEAEIRVSRAIRKNNLRRAAKQAEQLAQLADKIWRSADHIVIRELREFVPLSLPSQSMRPLHQSGVSFIGVLEEFSLKTQWLGSSLTDDTGGPRRRKLFDHLVIGLAEYYHLITGEMPAVAKGGRFWRFIAAVVDLLREMQPGLRDAQLWLPPSDQALTMRLRRLARDRNRDNKSSSE
jgi:hypothetical protein